MQKLYQNKDWLYNIYTIKNLSTCGFSISDVEWLISQLNELGFKATRMSSNNVIHISTYSAKAFLNYIGKCPVKCYQYKWNY